MPLSRSASDPGISKPEFHCRRHKPDNTYLPFHCNSCDLTDLFLVARGTSSSGSTTWEPVRLTCHQGGHLSFQVLGQVGEVYLNVDWKKPFLAVPWQPLPMKGDLARPKDGKELFPFTLCYTPIQPRIRAAESTLARRTVLFAAAHERMRSRWLNAFGRLARIPESHTCKSKDTLGNFNSLNGRMRHQSCTFRHRRLPCFCPKRAEKYASSDVVRDIHDHFAIDPLSVLPKKRAGFFERYLDRQVEIERLLEDRQSVGQPEEDAMLQSYPGRFAQTMVLSGVQSASTPEQKRSKEQRATHGRSGMAKSSSPDMEPGATQLPILARTSSAILSGDVLVAERWSAGVLFRPPNDRVFSLSVCLLDPPDTHPLFIGIAPPETDVSTVNCFTSGNVVLLCAGGGGFSEGSTVHALGECVAAELPMAKPGSRLSVHYEETGYLEASGASSQVRFTVGNHDTGNIHVEARRSGKNQPAAWVPLVLLCVPGTRVCVELLK